MSYNHEKLRDTLIRYGTSQLTSHGSIVIGLSVILFAFLDLVNQHFETPAVIEFPLRFTMVSLRYILVFVFMGVLMGGIICVLARFLVWGRILSRVVHVKDLPKNITIPELWDRISQLGDTPILKLLTWLSAGVEGDLKGLAHSMLPGFAISSLLMWVFLFQ